MNNEIYNLKLSNKQFYGLKTILSSLGFGLKTKKTLSFAEENQFKIIDEIMTIIEVLES